VDFHAEARLIEARAALLNAEINMHAMIAENKHRENVGQGIAYGEDAFMELVRKFGVGCNDISLTLYPERRQRA
jgi:hypothetical protein